MWWWPRNSRKRRRHPQAGQRSDQTRHDPRHRPAIGARTGRHRRQGRHRGVERPAGVFEFDQFASGTQTLAKAIADSPYVFDCWRRRHPGRHRQVCVTDKNQLSISTGAAAPSWNSGRQRTARRGDSGGTRRQLSLRQAGRAFVPPACSDVRPRQPARDIRQAGFTPPANTEQETPMISASPAPLLLPPLPPLLSTACVNVTVHSGHMASRCRANTPATKPKSPVHRWNVCWPPATRTTLSPTTRRTPSRCPPCPIRCATTPPKSAIILSTSGEKNPSGQDCRAQYPLPGAGMWGLTPGLYVFDTIGGQVPARYTFVYRSRRNLADCRASPSAMPENQGAKAH